MKAMVYINHDPEGCNKYEQLVMIYSCYISSQAFDIHKGCCGEWLVMWVGVGLPCWKV